MSLPLWYSFLAAFRIRLSTTKSASESPRSKLTVPTLRRQRPPPDLQALPFSQPNGCYVQFSLIASLGLFQSSNKEAGKKRHNIELGSRPASQQGADAVGSAPGLASLRLKHPR